MAKPAIAMIECIVGGKVCRKCERRLELQCFHRSHSNKDGLQGACRECFRKQQSAKDDSKGVAYNAKPIQRAHYREVVVNGQRMIERYIA